MATIDITLLVMAQSTSVADGPSKWRLGEIVDLFPLEQCPGPAGHPLHLHVHVLGVPCGTIPAIIDQRKLSPGDLSDLRYKYIFAGLKENLTAAHWDNPENETVKRASRRFVLDFSAVDETALRKNREITLTWEDVKAGAIKARQDRSLALSIEAVKDTDVKSG